MIMHDLNVSALWTVAGWTMLHFMWIGALVGSAAWMVRQTTRRLSPNIRYASTLALLALLATAPIAIAVRVGGAVIERRVSSVESLNADHGEAASAAVAPTEIIDLAQNPPPPSLGEGLGEGVNLVTNKPFVIVQPQETSLPRALHVYLTHLAPHLPWLWLVGTPLTFAWLVLGLAGAERLRLRGQPIGNGPLRAACDRLQQSLGITRDVALATCERIGTPVLVGIVRPIILLPPALVTGSTPDEIEMVLLHELAHVRRWDNLVNLSQRIVEAALFFHPAVWLVSHWVRQEREACCDAIVVAHTNEPHRYAETLVHLAARARTPQLASALGRHPLTTRVRRILKMEDESMFATRQSVLIAVLLLLTGVWVSTMLFPRNSTAEDRTAEPAESAEQERIVQSRESRVSGAAGSGDYGPVQVSRSSPFPTLAEQKMADRAWKVLGLELEKIVDEDIDRVKELGFDGGLRVAAVQPTGVEGFGRGRGAYPIQLGDLLVGLHVWPTRTLTEVGEVLDRDDLQELSPLKFYVVRAVAPDSPDAQRGRRARGGEGEGFGEYGGYGEFGGYGGEMGGYGAINETIDTVITGRIHVDTQHTRHLRRAQQEAERERETNAQPATYNVTPENPYSAPTPPASAPLQPPQPSAAPQARLNPLQNVPRPELPDTSQIDAKPKALPRDADWTQYPPLSQPDAKRDRYEPVAESWPQPHLAPSSNPPSTLRYDSKTFDQWRSLWRQELKTEQRTEAIRALAAFATADPERYGKEAAEAILDVAGEYDFQFIESNSDPQGALKERIISVLAGQGSRRVPEKYWFDELLTRYEAEPKRWNWFGQHLLGRFRTDDPKIRAKLLKLAGDDDTYLGLVALQGLLTTGPWHNPGARKFDDLEAMKLLRKRLASNDADRVRSVLFLLSYNKTGGSGNQDMRSHYVPELNAVLFHEDEGIRRQARGVAQWLDEKYAQGLAEQLVDAFEKSDDVQTKLAALRAIAAMKEKASVPDDWLKAIITESDNKQLQIAAAVAMERKGEVEARKLLSRSAYSSDEGSFGRGKEVDQMQKDLDAERLRVFTETHYQGGGFF